MEFKSKIVYCCICGERILNPNSTHTTGFMGEFEEYSCGTHSEQEINDYCAKKTPAYDSRTGGLVSEK